MKKRDEKGGKKERKKWEKWEKGDKELEEYSFVKNKHTTLNVGQKKIVLGGPKVRESRKVFSKGDGSFQKGWFRTCQPGKGAGNDFTPHEGRGKDQKGKG